MESSQTVYSASHSSTINELANPEAFQDGTDLAKKDSEDPYLVGFHEGDPENPKNWSRFKRWYLTLTGGLLILNATFASSAPSSLVPQLMHQFGFSEEVGSLTISVFVAGYCVGPLLWGPLSEQLGRRPLFIVTFLIYTIFQIACAVAQNTAQILVFRFLAGVFAASPLTNSGALISDIWDTGTRGTALAAFTLAPFAGPALGPAVSGFIVVSGQSWRWLFWVMSIFAGVCTIQIVLTLPETYAPIILVEKAKRLRKETGNQSYYAPLEKQDKVNFSKRLEHILARPFVLLFQEPMLAAITVYMSFVYGCLYVLFEAYPIVFAMGHHFNAGISGLMFLPLLLGGLTAVITYIFVFNPRYTRAMEKHAPHPVPPEFRLEIALIAAPLFAGSFFWFAWTSNPSISFWAPMMSGSIIGFSILWIFLALFNYVIDTYLFVAASALAANTVCRSLVGAAFPLFARQMYERLGTPWASSLLGFIALAMVPIPLVLMKYGGALRAKSKYAPTRPGAAMKEKLTISSTSEV
jgi:multidrug resistance protein